MNRNSKQKAVGKERGARSQIANCKLQIANCFGGRRAEGGGRNAQLPTARRALPPVYSPAVNCGLPTAYCPLPTGFPLPPSALRPGFTLVEMLVVIAIIAILAGLISGAAMRARVTAKNAVIASEVNQLDMAVKAYKEKYGDYPPDFSDMTASGSAAVTRHLAKAFPRYNANNWQADLLAVGVNISNLDPSTALVFWLGGSPTISGSKVTALNGFSANPSMPFDTTNTSSRTVPFFDFDLSRLNVTASTGGAKITYLPPNGKPQSNPYVYFKPRMNALNANIVDYPANGFPLPNISNTAITTIIRPYRDSQLSVTGTVWINAQSFQILSPGLDGFYGNVQGSSTAGINFPAGTDYLTAQYDDITNFSGGTLESKMP